MRLRVCTFNIHHGVGSDGRLDLSRTADVIEATGATVVGLQEVDRALSARSGWVDQAAWLGERLSMEVVHGATIDRDPNRTLPADPAAPGEPAPTTPRRRYGNALLSAHPIGSWRPIRLPSNPGREARGLVDANITVAGHAVRVAVTHLQNRSVNDRRAQIAHLLGLFGYPSRETPTILLGDLNAGPDRAEIRALTAVLTDCWAAVGDGPGRTFPARRPIARIDHVLVSSQLRPIVAEVPDTRASDHRPVVVELELPSPVPGPDPDADPDRR